MIFSGNKHKGPRGEPMPEPNEGLPDTYRLSGMCPRCGKQSSFDIGGSFPITFDGGYSIHIADNKQQPTYNEQCSVLICRHCSQGTAVIEEQWIGETRAKDSKVGGNISWRGLHWWPLPNSSIHSAIPPEIASSFNEANRAVSANCPRAGAVMARRTLEAITVERGVSNGTLNQRLKDMEVSGKLHKSLADWANEVRLIGNDGAHFDPIKNVSISDANDIINFISELLNYIYILPSELSRRRNKK